MKKSSNDNVRDRVMGLGQTSMRKSYYRELMEKQKDLERKNDALQKEIDRRTKAEQDLKALNEALEAKVQERTEALAKSNEILKDYIDELEETQNQLIEQEKMASLGTLVRGISHEINTPLGVGLTTASYLKSSVVNLQMNLKKGLLTKTEFENEIKGLIDGTGILLSSLEKSVTIVNNFKSIASDNTHEKLEEIRVYDFVDLVLNGMLNELETDLNLRTAICCDKNLILRMYPGILSQLLTILVSNTLQHGLRDKTEGKIDVELYVENESIMINYYDDGSGIDETILGNVFDPFFTTTRTGKTSGLGLYIAYNLITQMNGSISVQNLEYGGLVVKIVVPVDHKFSAD